MGFGFTVLPTHFGRVNMESDVICELSLPYRVKENFWAFAIEVCTAKHSITRPCLSELRGGITPGGHFIPERGGI